MNISAATKIFVVGPQFPDSFARNVAVTLEMMGFEVSTGEPVLFCTKRDSFLSKALAYGVRFLPSLEFRSQEELLRKVEKSSPHLILVTHGGLSPRTVKVLRDMVPAVAAWYPDVTANLDREYLLGSDYHCLFFKEPRSVALFQKNIGLPAYFLPECCNPLWHRRVDCTAEELSKYQCDVAMAGNCYYYRLRMLEELAAYDLKFWGGAPAAWLQHPLLRCHRRYYVAETQKAKAFNAARIVLNTLSYKETDSLNCRLFEATGCGGFVLTEARPGLADFFEPGREVAVFESRQDLADKVRFYLAHPQERAEIAQAGYRRAHREHTYENRLRILLNVVTRHTGVNFLLRQVDPEIAKAR